MTEWARIRREQVLLDDEAVLVINKPAGISVMGERHEADLVTLAKDAGEELFPAHRIDKVTSGVVLFAKELRFHGDLTRQFHRRSVDKRYLLLTRTRGLPERGTIDLPLSVGRKNRVRVAAHRSSIVAGWADSHGADSDGMAAVSAAGHWSVPPAETFTHVRTYPSVTDIARMWEGAEHTLLAAHPVTGRRHQIRVHLAWIGHPIQGDPLFDKNTTTRTFLHSWRLGFDAAWSGGTRVEVEALPGADFWAPIRDQLPDGSPSALLEHARSEHSRNPSEVDP